MDRSNAIYELFRTQNSSISEYEQSYDNLEISELLRP